MEFSERSSVLDRSPRAFRNGDRDLMARCLAWGAENGFSAEEIAGDNPIPPEVTDDTGEDLDDELAPSVERVDASRAVRLGEGPETVYVYDTAYCRDVVKIAYTVMPAIDRIVQQIATGMPGKPRTGLLKPVFCSVAPQHPSCTRQGSNLQPCEYSRARPL